MVTFGHAAIGFIPNVPCLRSSAQVPLLQFREPRRRVLQRGRRMANGQPSSEELTDQGKRLPLFFGRIDGSGKTIIRYDLIPSLQKNLSYVAFSLNFSGSGLCYLLS